METRNKIKTPGKASQFITTWQKKGEKVVFTNGCFDLIHLGHIDYLEKSRNLGDHLVIGLNTDESVRRIKGPARPVNDETARSRVLAALAFVDMVILFDEETPLELITFLKPDILVKGKDYQTENIVGAKFVMGLGGNVITLDLVQGYSTTALIEKIKKVNK